MLDIMGRRALCRRVRRAASVLDALLVRVGRLHWRCGRRHGRVVISRVRSGHGFEGTCLGERTKERILFPAAVKEGEASGISPVLGHFSLFINGVTSMCHNGRRPDACGSGSARLWVRSVYFFGAIIGYMLGLKESLRSCQGTAAMRLADSAWLICFEPCARTVCWRP